MAQGLRLNNGNTFNIVDVVAERQYAQFSAGTIIGLAAGEIPAEWLDLSSYINADWEPEMTVGHPYGYVHYLNNLDTISNLQPYLEWVNNNGAFIWGDAYKGGMYICKRSATTYNIYMFCGSGIYESDNNYMRFYIHDYATTQDLTEDQIKHVTILHTIFDNVEVNRYCVWYPGVWGDIGSSIELYAAPHYDNPLDPDQITEVVYTAGTVKALSECLVDNTQITVNPIGWADNFQTPKYAIATYINTAGYPNTYTLFPSQEIGERGYSDDPDYIQKGSWWGGDGNKVTQDPNTGSTNSTGGGYGVPSQTSIPCGGTGDHQYDSDGTTAGFFTIFEMSESNMSDFNAWLMDKTLDTGAIWSAIWDALKRVYQQPLDLVLGAAAIKHDLREKAASQEIKFAGIGTEIFAPTAYQYQTLDMGSIEINEQYKSFMDYNGYSETLIYLPMIGYQSLEQNDIMGSTLHLVYQIDNLTGACIAQLEVKRSKRIEMSDTDDTDIESYLYTFQGNCFEQLPLTANDWQQAFASTLNICTGAVSSAASAIAGNPAGALGGVAGIAKDALNLKPSIKHASSTSSCFGMMDGVKPYLILKRPIRGIPGDLAKFYGYRCSKSTYIKECQGYTKVYNAANLADNIPCTDEEKKEIEELLMNGIIV